jgi:hypothetical protein
MKILFEIMKNKKFKVVRVDNNEFELENGDVYPHNFELDNNITVEKFQKLLDNSKEFILKMIKDIDE